MGQTYAGINTGSGGDSVKTCLDNLETMADTLRSCFSGTSSPSSPVEGQLWADTSATPYLLKAYLDIGAGAAWVVIGPVARLNSAISLDPSSGATRATVNEIVAALEDRGAVVAPAAGNVGYIYLLTTDGAIYYSADASTRKALLSIAPSSSYDSIEMDLDGSNLNDGTNPPTLATKGTTPTVKGWLFDAINEKRVLVAKVPANWDGASDLRVRLTCVLNAAETNGDDIEWTGVLVAVTPGTDAVSKSSTAMAASATDIGTGSAEGVEHNCDLVVDYDDATNPVAAGDTLYIEINRTEVTNVVGVIVTAARLLYFRKALESRA